jgi:hypothetical protein
MTVARAQVQPAPRKYPVHPQEALPTVGGAVFVDELIAPLIRYLWAAGCSTEFSCQGDTTEFAHVIFPDARSLHAGLKALLALALRSGDNTMPPRLAGHGSPFHTTSSLTTELIHFNEADQWAMTAWPKLGFVWQFEIPFAPVDPLRYRVSFPHRDLRALIKVL